jgi:bifunctional non-homologous end joining protein LigD
MVLREYRSKRDFRQTSEPRGADPSDPSGRLYVIQKHAARRLHYDLRLELEGTLKSWAVPKGPSLRSGEKRLAVHVEDHPVEYGSFEGIIPKGEYGGGTVMLWDRGEWEPVGDPREGYRSGKLKFRIHGEKLKGLWTLVRMHGKGGEEDKNWILLKDKDEEAHPSRDILEERPLSVSTLRSMEEIAGAWDPVEGAVKGTLPQRFTPQLATPSLHPPEGDGWIHEIKYDGYRILCLVKDHKPSLISRNGKDWTQRFRQIADAVSSLPVSNVVLDGEIVVLRPDGTTDFQALQNLLQGIGSGNLVYYLFDLLHYEGYDLTGTPLLRRKELLRRVIENSDQPPSPLRYSDHIRGEGPEVFLTACRLSLEGIVSKRVDSRYLQKRSRSWLKIKCFKRQEFVIGGYTEPSGSRKGFGAVLVGYFDEKGELIYAGRVGTGFDEQTLSRIKIQMEGMVRKDAPFTNPPVGREARGVHWVAPELVAEVEFSEWTHEGILRQPSFKGLREDRSPGEVSLEKPLEAGPGPNSPFPRKGSPQDRVAGVPLTNPDRILYPAQGITKWELARFYEEIADWILPHISRRPLMLLRCPEGHGKECFYQKHLDDPLPGALRGLPIREKGKEGVQTHILLDDVSGLISLVQLGVLEIHPWPCREDDLERPDRMIFDLDPGPDVEWEEVVRCAGLLRDTLRELGLESFVKTSGGKGLHVVVPLIRRTEWSEMKAFSRAIAEGIAREEPRSFVTTVSKQKRKGKIFIDYIRNSRGATTVGAYSTRALPGAPVSTPVGWDELFSGTKSDAFTLENLPHRLRSLPGDPWAHILSCRQSITKRMKREVGLSE